MFVYISTFKHVRNPLIPEKFNKNPHTTLLFTFFKLKNIYCVDMLPCCMQLNVLSLLGIFSKH